MLERFINKQKPYNHSNNVHKKWIVAKLLLENESLQYLAKTVILETNDEQLTLKRLANKIQR